MLGYIVDEKVFVLLNAGPTEKSFDNIILPDGQWKLIANNYEVNHVKGIKEKKTIKKLEGNTNLSILMEPESLRIWVKE